MKPCAKAADIAHKDAKQKTLDLKKKPIFSDDNDDEECKYFNINLACRKIDLKE